MSGNGQKNTARRALGGDSDAASRLVAMPKTPSAGDQPGNERGDKSKSAPRREKLGDLLREARQRRGEDLQDIGEYLRIKPALLLALENGRYDAFPADAYVVGFLSTYAVFLGYNGKEMIALYRQEMHGVRKNPVLSMPVALSEGRAPSTVVLIAACVAALFVYALWYGFSSTNRTQVQKPVDVSTVVSSSSTETVPVAPPISATHPSPPVAVGTHPPPPSAAAPASPPAGIVVAAGVEGAQAAPAAPLVSAPPQSEALPAARVVIRATQSSWVMVTDKSGKTLYDHVMKGGESYKVPAVPGLSLTTGNGAGIVLSLDGTDLPPLSTGTPHVVRNIPLDPDSLTTGSASSDH